MKPDCAHYIELGNPHYGRCALSLYGGTPSHGTCAACPQRTSRGVNPVEAQLEAQGYDPKRDYDNGGCGCDPPALTPQI